MILEDFYEEVLRELGVLAAEETADNSDRLAVKEKYEQIHAEYYQREVISFFDDEDVPDWLAHNFAVVVANRLSRKFALDAQQRVELKLDANIAISTIIADGSRLEKNHPETEYY